MKNIGKLCAGVLAAAALVLSCNSPLADRPVAKTGTGYSIDISVDGIPVDKSSNVRALMDDSAVGIVSVYALIMTDPEIPTVGGYGYLTKGTSSWTGTVTIAGTAGDPVMLIAEGWKGGSTVDPDVPYVVLYNGMTTTNLTLGTDTSASLTLAAYSSVPGWYNLQSPATLSFAPGGSGSVYAQVYAAGVTDDAMDTTGEYEGDFNVWIGVSATDTDPATWPESAWTLATYNTKSGNNYEYMASITAADAGTYYYASRFQLLQGAFVYGGTDATGTWAAGKSGVLTVATPEYAYVSSVEVSGTAISNGTIYALPGADNWLPLAWDNTCMATAAASGKVVFSFGSPAEINTVSLAEYTFSVVTSGTWTRPGSLGDGNLDMSGLGLVAGNTYVIYVDTSKVGNASLTAVAQ